MANVQKINSIKNLSLDDSRISAKRQLGKLKWPVTRNLTLLLLIIAGSAVAVNFLIPILVPASIYSAPLSNALLILLIATLLWITEAIPPFAVGFLIMGLSVFFLESLAPLEISQDWEKYVGTWSSPVIWILLGGFILAAGAQITGFDRKFSRLVINSFGNKPYRLILGIMITTGVLSMFISNTATTAMMITIVIPFARRYGPYEPAVKSMLLGISSAATFGGMGTVIGSSPNAIALGILQAEGYKFTFVDWMKAGVPASLILIIISWLVLRSIFKSELEYMELDLQDEITAQDSNNRNTAENRFIVIITFILTVSLWMTSAVHRLPVAVVSLIPIVIFTATGIVRAEEIKMIPWDTLVLVSGGLTLGIVINESGLASSIVHMIPHFGNYVLVILFLGFMTSVTSNIMSNTAAASILIPLSIALVPDHFTVLMVLTVGFSASTALFLPISTPPNALVFSTGYLNQSDYRLPGMVTTLVSPFLIMALVFLATGIS